MSEKERKTEKKQKTDQQQLNEQAPFTEEEIRQYQEIYEKAPDIVKQLFDELSKYIAERLNTLLSKVSLLPSKEALETLTNGIHMLAMELNKKYWPKIVDMISKDKEVAEFFKVVSPDITSYIGTVAYIIRIIDQDAFEQFMASGVSAAVLIIGLKMGIITVDDLRSPIQPATEKDLFKIEKPN